LACSHSQWRAVYARTHWAQDKAFAPMARADPVSLGRIDGNLSVLGVVAERRHATDPKALALGGRNLVADALGGDLPLELGK
jgi:hypothetical protein